MAEWAGPLVGAGCGSLEFPSGLVFESVVVATEGGEVFQVGGSAFGVGDGVVDVAF